MSATAPLAQPAASGVLSRARIVAPADYDRWLVPPAALAVHLCIGMVYGMSVFWLPLAHSVGTACPASMGFLESLTATGCYWSVPNLVVGFEISIVFLGCSAALWGGWLERVGPRQAGVVASLCWSAGLAVAALGIYVHQLWIMWLGFGAIGGIGLGIGYISPVSTLVAWFPDRRGMATGMAIMGFGGGAMIGAPLATMLMANFGGPGAGPGVWQTLLVLAAIYLVFMLAGSFGYRVPPPGWAPRGFVAPARAGAAAGNLHWSRAAFAPQFWLIWIVLLMNVSAGIGVLSVASPMLQQLFVATPAAAAGFVGLLSVFNIAGRFFWSSISDRIGRKATYAVFFLLGIALYGAAPWTAHSGQKGLFVAFCCVIMSMYGGGFATVPAYLSDVFGPRFVGAIHGRLLTAWSTAGVVGPLLASTISQHAQQSGVAKAFVYDQTFYVMAGLLAAGFLANLLVRPLAARWFADAPGPLPATPPARPAGPAPHTSAATLAVAWACVLLPMAWGLYMTLSKVGALF
jgi:MFS family permease